MKIENFYDWISGNHKTDQMQEFVRYLIQVTHFFYSLLFFYYFVCVRILCECMFVYHFWDVVPREAKWQNHISRNWNYWWLWVNMWVPGIEPKSFVREVSPLNCWTICPVCTFILYEKKKNKAGKTIHLPYHEPISFAPIRRKYLKHEKDWRPGGLIMTFQIVGNVKTKF